MDDGKIDNDLARLTAQGLSIGPSIVSKLEESFVLLSSKLLHPGLYTKCSRREDYSMGCKATANSSSSSAAAAAATHSAQSSTDRAEVGERGVPGFPDFPDTWVGAPSSARRQISGICGAFKHFTISNSKSTPPPTSRRSQASQRLHRNAVNIYGIKSALTTISNSSKAIKKAKRNERKIRRIEKIAQLRERQRRKRDMREICRGMGLIKCD
jgi:hypothetical protein